ncbi:MAG TPA: hypothetical protein VFS08_14510 [Gemmatimonadaceae bacterium]|nr:hypothetical protein [Gemmatimonadaceae bacterium]
MRRAIPMHRSSSSTVRRGPGGRPHPERPRGVAEQTIAGQAMVARTLALAFAPLHKLAFGVAIGTACAVIIAAVTIAQPLLDPQDRTGLWLLSNYFVGYEETWRGALVGGAWGFGVGFVGGWFVAFVRNLVLAIWLLVVRARADLESTRDFIDHI